MPSKVLIVGLGSIGKRHARLLLEHFPHEVVALRSYSGQEPNDLGVPEVWSWEGVHLQGFDVAVVSNPTYLHIDTARRCAEEGLHLFIEKPIDCRLSGLDDLIRITWERGLSTYVAYPLRFHPLVRCLRERLAGRKVLHATMVCASFMPDWRPRQDHRRSYSAFAKQGGGVLLDMSHELDMAEYLFGPVLSIEGKLGRVSGVTVDSDDCADLVLTHAQSTTNVHLNLFARKLRRYIEVDTSDGSLSADLRTGSLTDTGRGTETAETFSSDGDYMYLEQLRYFFANVGCQDIDNSLSRASGLYKQIVEFREAQGYGSIDNDMRPGWIRGG